jgi:hypothetical protein
MALPNPTSIVTAGATLSVSDIVSSAQIVNRVVPSVNFKALEVQYQGYVNVAAGGLTGFTPIAPVISWAVVFVRNFGGQGSGNVVINITPTGGGLIAALNLDVGGVFLYISPLLSAVTISAIAPGITAMTITTGSTTSGNLELCLAG